MAVKMANVLKSGNIDALWLLLGFIIVVLIVDLLITGAIAKWAIFAPIFVPLLMKLVVQPEAVLAAYRVGDSPPNAIAPLNAVGNLIGNRTEIMCVFSLAATRRLCGGERVSRDPALPFAKPPGRG